MAKRLRLTKGESVLTSLFVFPLATLALALPMACAGGQVGAAGISTTVATVTIESRPTNPQLESIKNRSLVIKAALDQDNDLVEKLLTLPGYQAELEKIVRLASTNLETAVSNVYVVHTEFGRGSGTVIACIPFAVAKERPASSIVPDHIPWKLDPNEPDPEASKPEFVYKYKIWILTARHVVEEEIEIQIPSAEPQTPDGAPPLPTPEDTPKPETQTVVMTATDIATHNSDFSVVLREGTVRSLPADYDAALVEFISDEPVAMVQVRTEPLRITETIYSAGYGGESEDFWISLGVVSDPDGRATASVTFGDSGGAVLDQYGRLAGIPVEIELIETSFGKSLLHYHMGFVSIANIENWLAVEFYLALFEVLINHPVSN